MVQLSRHPKQSTEALLAIDRWYDEAQRAIMADEGLIPAAKDRHLKELRKEYKERWFLAHNDAQKDLAEWADVFRSRAEEAAQPKMPKDREARILKHLELQRIDNRIERYRDQPVRLLADYEKAVRSGDDVVAHELEEALPELLSKGERANFQKRAAENRRARLSEGDRKKIEEAEAFERERQTVLHAIGLQRSARNSGYLPGQITPTMLETFSPAGRPPEIREVPNPRWRDPALARPITTQPRGGVIGPDPGSGDPGSDSSET